MNKQVSVIVLLVVVASLLLYGCGIASMANGTLSAVAIPPTPTASSGKLEVTTDSEPAYALLRDAQQAMQHVSTYYFKQDNSTDTHLSETSKDVNVPSYVMHLEGQAMPPIARYHGQQAPSQFKYVAVGTNLYHLVSGDNEYSPTTVADYNPFLVTGALDNPQEYINFTLDTAQCATIIGDEEIGGVATTHLRFVLPSDPVGMRGQGGAMYAREIWIDKDTHYLRQLQINEIFSHPRSCEAAFTIGPSSVINYTSAILTYFKHNEPISPPIEAPFQRVPRTP